MKTKELSLWGVEFLARAIILIAGFSLFMLVTFSVIVGLNVVLGDDDVYDTKYKKVVDKNLVCEYSHRICNIDSYSRDTLERVCLEETGEFWWFGRRSQKAKESQ